MSVFVFCCFSGFVGGGEELTPNVFCLLFGAGPCPGFPVPSSAPPSLPSHVRLGLPGHCDVLLSGCPLAPPRHWLSAVPPGCRPASPCVGLGCRGGPRHTCGADRLGPGGEMSFSLGEWRSSPPAPHTEPLWCWVRRALWFYCHSFCTLPEPGPGALT